MIISTSNGSINQIWLSPYFCIPLYSFSHLLFSLSTIKLISTPQIANINSELLESSNVINISKAVTWKNNINNKINISRRSNEYGQMEKKKGIWTNTEQQCKKQNWILNYYEFTMTIKLLSSQRRIQNPVKHLRWGFLRK